MRNLTIVAVLLTTLTWAAAAQACDGTGDNIAATPLSEVVESTDCLVNLARQEHGLLPLADSLALDKTAQDWAETMVRTGFFEHGNLDQRILAAGYDYMMAGENIGTGGNGTPKEIVQAWLGSPGHRANILDPRFSDVGTGEIPTPVPGIATVGGTWVQDFAAPRNLIQLQVRLFRLPVLRGKTLARGRRLVRRHFRIGLVRRIRACCVKHGHVVKAVPSGGSQLEPGTRIAIYLRR